MRRVGVSLLAVGCALLAPAAIEARLPLDKPPPSTLEGTAPKPDKPPKKKPPSGTGWLGTADAICDDGLKRRTALLAGVSQHPSSTARKTLLRILTGTALIEDRMLHRLAAVRPPRGERETFASALRLFRLRHAEDKRLIATLKRGWNAGGLERQTRHDRLLNARVARLWDRLGAGACSKYFRSLG